MAVYVKNTAACAVLPLGPTGAQVTLRPKMLLSRNARFFGLVALLQVVWSDVGKLFKWNQ